MMRFPGRVYLIILALGLGCSGGPHAGYTEVADQVYYKLHALGDGDRLPTDSDSVLVRLRIARSGEAPGSLYSTERWFAGLHEVLPVSVLPSMRLREGDSASVIAPARAVPWTAIGSPANTTLDSVSVHLELAIRGLRSREESRSLARERLQARTASDEDTILARYFAGVPEVWKEFMGVRYVLDAHNPHAPVIRSGQLVCMHYTAHFLDDGHLFDDTHRGGAPLTFRLGDPDQVIKGLEVAAHLLPDGGRGRFVVPSALAFGAEGSSSGIVPPFTPVLYTIEAWVPTVDSARVAR